MPKGSLVVCLILAATLPAMVSWASAEQVSFPGAKLAETDQPRSISGVITRAPAAGAQPAVVLLHTCGGVRPHVLRDWPAFLAELGYASLVVDTFGSRGIKRCPTPLTNDRSELSRDVLGALDYLATLPFVDSGKIAVMGFSLGGNTIDYVLAEGLRSPGGRMFKAAISLYGRCSLVRKAQAAIPLLVVIGDRELERRLAPCRTMAEHPQPPVKVHILPDTYHGFDQQDITSVRNDSGGNPMLYNREATQRSRELVRDFLADNFRR